MYQPNIKYVARLLVLLSTVGFGLYASSVAKASDGPDLPAQCSSIEIPVENKLVLHVYARGVQIYRWNGTTWDFQAPRATLFAEENYFGDVGIHYAGPKWESKSGSVVEGRRVTGTGCTPDPTAIPWLLLSKYSVAGSGIFNSVIYIQRVNTTGGLVPAAPGLTEGELKEVPYTAEYYFYRAQN